MEAKKRSGRPKKAEHEKVKYQRIAVYSSDYERLSSELARRGGKKLTDAFSEMVTDYLKKPL